MKDLRNNYFGYNLKYLRKCYNLSQKQMGEIVGRSYRAISRWELSEREPQNNDIQKTAYLCHFSAFYEKKDCHIYCPKMVKVPVK